MIDSKVQQRFWSKVDIRGENECWEFKAGKSKNGYGSFGITPKQNIGSHRFAYLDKRGTIPLGLFVCHSCDNRLCCNPTHLWLGTPADNMNDMIDKGRDNGPKGERQHLAKLTAVQVLAIRADTRSLRAIAKDYGVHNSVISRIKRRDIWSHI